MKMTSGNPDRMLSRGIRISKGASHNLIPKRTKVEYDKGI